MKKILTTMLIAIIMVITTATAPNTSANSGQITGWVVQTQSNIYSYFWSIATLKNDPYALDRLAQICAKVIIPEPNEMETFNFIGDDKLNIKDLIVLQKIQKEKTFVLDGETYLYKLKTPEYLTCEDLTLIKEILQNKNVDIPEYIRISRYDFNHNYQIDPNDYALAINYQGCADISRFAQTDLEVIKTLTEECQKDSPKKISYWRAEEFDQIPEGAVVSYQGNSLKYSKEGLYNQGYIEVPSQYIVWENLDLAYVTYLE